MSDWSSYSDDKRRMDTWKEFLTEAPTSKGRIGKTLRSTEPSRSIRDRVKGYYHVYAPGQVVEPPDEVEPKPQPAPEPAPEPEPKPEPKPEPQPAPTPEPQQMGRFVLKNMSPQSLEIMGTHWDPPIKTANLSADAPRSSEEKEFLAALDKFVAFVGPFMGAPLSKLSTDPEILAITDKEQQKQALATKQSALQRQIFEGGYTNPVSKIIDSDYLRGNKEQLIQKYQLLRQKSPATAAQIYQIANLFVGRTKTKSGVKRRTAFLDLMRSVEWDPTWSTAMPSYSGPGRAKGEKTSGEKEQISQTDLNKLRKMKAKSVGSSSKKLENIIIDEIERLLNEKTRS